MVTWNTNSKYAGADNYQECKTAYTNSLSEVAVEPGGELLIVIRYKVGKDANRNIKLGDKKVATEIYSYASNEGLIANSAKPNNISNNEKDSDISPTLTISTNGKTRSIQGFAWEDQVNAVVNGVKTGDGLYAENEAKINNIEIELVEKVKNVEGEEAEYILAHMTSGNKEQLYADNDGTTKTKQMPVDQGEYLFNEIIPGNYIIRFTYGANGIDFTYNGQYYKSTKVRGINTPNASDATDNKERRKQVLEITKTINNENGEILANPNIDPTKYIEMTAMYADTNNLYLQIEHDNNSSNSIDFGLVKRPHTGIEITKEIKEIKLIKNGFALVDTANGVQSMVQKLKDETRPDLSLYKTYNIYLDDEIVYGSELIIDYEIVVKNISENDNLANYFEYDTAYGTREEQDKLFTTSVDLVHDYSQTLRFNESVSTNWKEENSYDLLSDTVKEKLEGSKIQVLKTEALNRALKPGESTSVQLQLSRSIIRADNDDQVYRNDVEIIQYSNSGGRRNEQAIPGNYIPEDESTSEQDTWYTEAIITRPTGQARIYYILGFAIGAMLICGIVLIKKFVLK